MISLKSLYTILLNLKKIGPLVVLTGQGMVLDIQIYPTDSTTKVNYLLYNLNLIEGSQRIGNSNFTTISGIGIRFNSVHWQNNKAIEVQDYTSVITTTEPNCMYKKSRLHSTYLTFPLLFETNLNAGGCLYFFLNAGAVAKKNSIIFTYLVE